MTRAVVFVARQPRSRCPGRVGGGGTRPYGFEADRLTARESEAVVIRECVARFLAGEPVRAICGDLNARGVPTVTGGPWKSQVLIRVISASRTSGQREHRGEIVGDAVWPAIVRPADTARIRAILADPARRTNRTARRYLLLRLLRCSRCDETLVSRPASGGVRRYICAKGTNYTGCGRRTSRRRRLSSSSSRPSSIGLTRPISRVCSRVPPMIQTRSAPSLSWMRRRRISTSSRARMASGRSVFRSGSRAVTHRGSARCCEEASRPSVPRHGARPLYRQRSRAARGLDFLAAHSSACDRRCGSRSCCDRPRPTRVQPLRLCTCHARLAGLTRRRLDGGAAASMSSPRPSESSHASSMISPVS